MGTRGVLAGMGLLLFAAGASAHKLEIEVKAEATVVRVTVGYDDESPAESARVDLRNAADEVVASGTADDRGICELPRPRGGRYTVIVDDGAGHRSRVTLDIPASPEEVSEARTEQRNRWLMTAIGLAVILGLTGLAWWRLRRSAGSDPASEGGAAEPRDRLAS